MRRPLIPVFIFSLLFIGCGQASSGKKEAKPPGIAQIAQAERAKENDLKVPKNRKVIYTADVTLVTDDLDNIRARLKTSLDQWEGFIAAEQLTGRTGLQRIGVWTVRIPVEKFSQFLDQLVTWGELENQTIKSDDVTEEFVDVESRLKNKRVEEQRLLTLLEEKTGNLEQVVALERAISEVREQIERMEGRMRYLADKIELTTITITIREVQNYVPPQPPTLTTEIARTFHHSLRELTEFGKQTLLVGVAITPWLIPLAVFFTPIALVFRRILRNSANASDRRINR